MAERLEETLDDNHTEDWSSGCYNSKDIVEYTRRWQIHWFLHLTELHARLSRYIHPLHYTTPWLGKLLRASNM